MNKAQIIDLPKISDVRGNLSFFESGKHLPFEIKRTFWIYDVPGGEERGGHAYHETEEFIVALSGSFDVVLDDGLGNKQVFHLNRSYYGLYVPKMMWREMTNFSTNSLALISSSTKYNPLDYIRNYNEFLAIKSHNTTCKEYYYAIEADFVQRHCSVDSVKSTVNDCFVI